MNEFVDMHVHSKFSIDGMSTMEDYCLIAGKTGTRVICFTEHPVPPQCPSVGTISP